MPGHPHHTARAGLRFVVLLVGLSVLTGCGSATWVKNGFIDPTQVGAFDKPVRNEIAKDIGILEEDHGHENAVEPSEHDLVVDNAETVITQGDIIQIYVPDLLQIGDSTAMQVPVGNSGFVTLMGIGRVKVAGFTARELELDLQRKLVEEGIMVEPPEVTVLILSSQLQTFSVVGSVSRPGQFVIGRPDFRLLDAIATVGGLPHEIKHVYILRKGASAGTRPPEHQPAPEPATMPDFEPTFTMSEFSAGAAGGMQETPPDTTQSPVEPIPMDDFELIDHAPTGPPPQPYFDEATQTWREGPPLITTSEPSTPLVPEQVPPGTAVPPRSPIAAPHEHTHGPELATAFRILEIPVDELMHGDMRYNVVIRPGDLIKVHEEAHGQYYLMGHVARPGAYEIHGEPLTIKEAIASAGGFDVLAWPARADLTRRVSEIEAQTVQLDLDAMFAGKVPDVYLKSNDILNVGTHPIASFLAVLRNSFRMSYGLGFVYDRNYADEDTFFAKEQLKARRRQERQTRGLPF